MSERSETPLHSPGTIGASSQGVQTRVWDPLSSQPRLGQMKERGLPLVGRSRAGEGKREGPPSLAAGTPVCNASKGGTSQDVIGHSGPDLGRKRPSGLEYPSASQAPWGRDPHGVEPYVRVRPSTSDPSITDRLGRVRRGSSLFGCQSTDV
ncbi:hypothetical protein EAI_05361 [Harpegnathos saltator]|uniref:Uncharacterized protein n=1 Tax=Harpegnathos saltator TaxID=610380 RepID=E2BTK8_HARSA|nr:hypothetical protein EAI_05361 [Harpegnathos saltator]